MAATAASRCGRGGRRSDHSAIRQVAAAGAVVMRLRVVGRRSDRLPPLVAVLRAIGCVLLPIGLICITLGNIIP
jgi:hypothetical protein